MSERVQVVVRIRPFIASDPPDAELNTIVVDPTHVSVGDNRIFKADRVFMMEDDSDEIYRDAVAPLVERFISGCNASVLAYGQTGTGKTYTVQAILPRLLTQVLEDASLCDSAKAHGVLSRLKQDPLLQLQYVEVYGETIRDLLEDPHVRQDPNQPPKLRLVTTAAAPLPNLLQRTTPLPSSPMVMAPEREKGGGGGGGAASVYHSHTRCAVVGATLMPIYSIRDAAAAIARGDARRATAATNVHEHSSRSHAILTLFHPRYACRLDVVDLAGSEREKKTGNTGVRFQESIAINTGLLALGNVIRALSRNHRSALVKEANLKVNTAKYVGGGGVVRDVAILGPQGLPTERGHSQHIPYRSSKLTRLLQDTLGGSSATLFIACVAPDTYNRDETLRTLQYCSLALQVLNAPIRQFDRLQRAQSRGRRERGTSAGNSPTSIEDNHHSSSDDDDNGKSGAVEQLRAAYVVLQQQYDEQSEVLASICESYTSVKEQLEVWEGELRKDETLFTRQMRVMQRLVQQNQKLRHRLAKATTTSAQRTRKCEHTRAAQQVDARHAPLQDNVDAPGVVEATSDVDDDDVPAHSLLRRLLRQHEEMNAADVATEGGRDVAPSIERAGVRAAAAAAAASGPPLVSTLSPYRHLSFKSGSMLRESVSNEGLLGLGRNSPTQTPGAASEAAPSEPVQSFIRSLLRQHGIVAGKTATERDMADGDAVSFNAQTQAPAQLQVGMSSHENVLTSPPSTQTAAVKLLPNASTTDAYSSSSRLEAPLPRGAPRDVQLLQLANEVLRYEETNTSLRNQVRLLQAKLDDKAREAARLRLEVQDMKDVYSSLSALTE